MFDELWLPIIDRIRCTGCGDCVIICPAHALALKGGKAVLVKPLACNYCADCESVCPTGAVSLPYRIVLAGEIDSTELDNGSDHISASV
ncbi:MAG: ferredoxin family protein [Caldilineaceae bacterium]|nr:ferredoxin family protein [Caldilineaceae bacterium]